MSKMMICLIVIASFALGTQTVPDVQEYSLECVCYEEVIEQESQTQEAVVYTDLAVPDINSSFKAYMDYRTITDRTSPQYRYISQNAWSDNQGFMRADAEEHALDDYYLIALGSFYGTDIGAKYRITTDSGGVFYGVLADCKADQHTNSTNQYTVVGTPNIVEFIVDTKTLNKDVKYHGSAGVYKPLSGNIVKIERIEENYDG